MANPHDALFKAIFSSPTDAAGLIRPLLPASVASAIDWDRLELVPGSFVDDALRHRHTDLLFAAPIAGTPGLLYFLCEHKSRPERFVALHLLAYLVRIWTQWRKDHPRTRTLPRIVPVVVHHGQRPWTAPTSLRGLFDCDASAEAAAALDAAGADLTFLLDDLTRVDETDLRRRPVSALAQFALDLLRALRGADAAVALRIVGRWLDALGAKDGTQRITVLWSYVLHVSEVDADPLGEVVEAAGPEARETLMSTANKLRAEGRAEGRSEGGAEILLRLLNRRFGPLPEAITDRVRAGSVADLEHWADAVLTATSLDAVFGDA